MMAHGWATRMSLVGIILSGTAPCVLAQNLKRTLPQPAPVDGSTPTLPPTTVPAAEEDETVVLEQLAGLWLTAPNAATSRPVSVGGVVVDVPALQGRVALQGRLAPFLGKRLTVGTLNQITAEITREFYAMGRPIVSVVVPEQDVTDGVVRVDILEGVVGEVRVEGARHFKPERLRKQIRIGPGDVIETPKLLDDLNWLDRNPFRSVDVVFDKGQSAGTTDVVVRVTDAFPLRVYTGYSNTGSDSTGEDRFQAGFNFGDTFGLDHQFSYQFTTGDQIDRFQSHGGSYQIPLSWRHYLSFIGSWSRSNPDLADARANSIGESWQIGARYEIPLGKIDRFTHGLTVGADFKRSNNNLEFGGETVYDRATDVIQLTLNYRGSRTDAHGSTSFDTALVLSPGNLSSNNDSTAFDGARTGSDATYFYLTASIDRYTNLPRNFTLVNRIGGQWSPEQLLSSEQFGVGGSDSVRGYEERPLNGDSGLFFSIELESPKLTPLKWLGSKWDDDLRLSLFSEAGLVANHEPDDNNPEFGYAWSVGPAMRYRIGRHLNMNLAYGFRLDDDDVGDDDSGRHHVNVTGSLSW
jgi:hemolysin activation/secretion protein